MKGAKQPWSAKITCMWQKWFALLVILYFLVMVISYLYNTTLLITASAYYNKKGFYAFIDLSFDSCLYLKLCRNQLKAGLNQNITVLHFKGNPCDSFDIAYTRILLRFILTVTGLQCQPKYCHIWDTSLRDHALWPKGKRMVKKLTLRCLLSLFFFYFLLHPPLLFYLAQLVRFTLRIPTVASFLHVLCGWLWIHLCLLFFAFISQLSFMIPSIIETSHPPLLPVRSQNPTSSPAQAPGPLPPPRELNYV